MDWESPFEPAMIGQVTPASMNSQGSSSGQRASDLTTDDQAQLFGEALRIGDAKRAEGVAEDAIAAGAETAVVHARVIAPAMRAIGTLWERGAIGVADE